MSSINPADVDAAAVPRALLPAPAAGPERLAAIWDGRSQLTVTFRQAPQGSAGYLFADGAAEGHAVLARRRVSLSASHAADEGAPLTLEAQLPAACSQLWFVLAAPSSSTLLLPISLEANLRPATALATDALAEAAGRSGINRWRGDAAPRLTIGPCLSEEAWRQRAVAIAIADEGAGWSLRLMRGEAPQAAAPAAQPAPALAQLCRLALVGRRSGWRLLEPDGDDEALAFAVPALGDDEALLALGAPGVSFTWATAGQPAVAAGAIALVPAQSGWLGLSLDEALGEAAGSMLAISEPAGGTGALTVGEAGAARRRLLAPFSPYDPHVQAARRAVLAGFRAAPAPGDGERSSGQPTGDPFAMLGWPPALRGGVARRQPADQALLLEWTLAEPVLGRLMAALQVQPDRWPLAADIAAVAKALEPITRPGIGDELRAAAIGLEDRRLRQFLLGIAEDLGRDWASRPWLPLSLIERAASLIEAQEPDAGQEELPAEAGAASAPPAGAATAQAARALLGEWEAVTNDAGLLAGFDVSQDPLKGAARLQGLALPKHRALARLGEELDARLRDFGGRHADAAALLPALAAAGRYLGYRHLVALADAAAGLGAAESAGDDEDALLHRALLRRMRTALPQGFDAYLAAASGGASQGVEDQLAQLWGLGWSGGA